MDETPGAALGRLIVGFQVSQAIHVAATLGVADLLADGPRTSDELAAATDSDGGSLYRLLRALASVGVFHEDEGRLFSLTPMGALLRSNVPGSLRGWAVHVGRPYFQEALGLSGAFHPHRRQRFPARARHRRLGRTEPSVQRRVRSSICAMESLTGASNRALLDAYDFGRFGSVVDVGGGNGALLAALLGEYPAMRGVPPRSAARRRQRPRRPGTGGRRRSMRDRGSGASSTTCPGGGDAYALKSIIHDHEDEPAVAILRVCRRAMACRRNRCFSSSASSAHPTRIPRTKFSDLNMLVAPAGKRADASRVGRPAVACRVPPRDGHSQHLRSRRDRGRAGDSRLGELALDAGIATGARREARFLMRMPG